MSNYTGKIYDLDFIQGNDWCQALLRKDEGSQNIAVVTSDPRMQSILETALIMSQEVEVTYEGKNPSTLTRAKINIASAQVATPEASMTDLLVQAYRQELETYSLNTIQSAFSIEKAAVGSLPYQSAKVFAYATTHCRGGNDCPDGSFNLDCTHFICHCLAATEVVVTNPSAACRKGLCIRAQDFAAAFHNVVTQGTFENVKLIPNFQQARRGDFCIVTSWFGLSKDHVMLLAETPQANGGGVYGHTSNRCGERAEFPASDCKFYRIEDR